MHACEINLKKEQSKEMIKANFRLMVSMREMPGDGKMSTQVYTNYQFCSGLGYIGIYSITKKIK